MFHFDTDFASDALVGVPLTNDETILRAVRKTLWYAGLDSLPVGVEVLYVAPNGWPVVRFMARDAGDLRLVAREVFDLTGDDLEITETA